MSELPSTRSIFVETLLKMTPVKRVVFLVAGGALLYGGVGNLLAGISTGEAVMPASDGRVVTLAGSPGDFYLAMICWSALLALAILAITMAVIGDRMALWLRGRNADSAG